MENGYKEMEERVLQKNESISFTLKLKGESFRRQIKMIRRDGEFALKHRNGNNEVTGLSRL